jgi:hypothetical protein
MCGVPLCWYHRWDRKNLAVFVLLIALRGTQIRVRVHIELVKDEVSIAVDHPYKLLVIGGGEMAAGH